MSTFIRPDHIHQIEDTIHQLIDFSWRKGFGLKLRMISDEAMILCAQRDFIFTPDENNFDYIYNIKKFLACEGKRYSTLRNQINRFKKKYPNVCTEIFTSFSFIKEKIVGLQERWNFNKNRQKNLLVGEDPESAALQRIFDLEQDNFIIVCIFFKNVMIGFCISELLPSSVYALSHFAKADVSFSGVYSYMLYETCAVLFNAGKYYLNYQQDLGLIELRHFKKSFHPVCFLKKYSVYKKENNFLLV